MIESYRVPSILDFARVRLHTGYESPNTYFVGRALKDSGTFDYDFVKVGVSQSTLSATTNPTITRRSSTLPPPPPRLLSNWVLRSAKLPWMDCAHRRYDDPDYSNI
jgi:hypothetical protein